MDTKAISDYRMIVTFMAILKESGLTKEQAVPIHSWLLEHYGMTAEGVKVGKSRVFKPRHDLPAAVAVASHAVSGTTGRHHKGFHLRADQ